MYFNGQFKQLGLVDVTELKSIIDTISEEQWCEHDKRQETFKVHSHTKTIPLIFDADFRHKFPTVHPFYEKFQHKLVPVMECIADYYKKQTLNIKNSRPNAVRKGYFARVILVKLAPNSAIAAHVDNGYSLSRCHRIHLPIVTNEKIEFTIDGVLNYLAEGQLTEINNRGMHGVKNLSDEVRIHFILDFVIPGEIVEDPTSGTLIA